MSKINAVRLINLNYNNNSIRISDETFHLNGESTLLSLRNGGGKSVLVQMITAPFVHRRYRDAKDRPFESYFTTNKPTFIMVEWMLDQGAGYVLTGMMVRRSQDTESTESLEMVNFISEYRDRCPQDIHHLPVVEKTKKEMILKNFGACRQLFESYKRDRSLHFFYYDMSNSSQTRQYFEKLKEYQIDYKEWETIIKKVNLKESGLSDLFADCRDEKGLVEKWFLEAVESKLNRERSRMKEFQGILEKYVVQYKDNQSKIERRDTIRLFREEAVEIEEQASRYEQCAAQEKEQENRIANFLGKLGELLENAQREIALLGQKQAELKEEIHDTQYQQLSREIHELKKEERDHADNRNLIDIERDALEQECLKIEEQLHLLECARQQGEVEEERRDSIACRKQLEAARQKEEDLEPERNTIGGRLYAFYERQLSDEKRENEQLSAQIEENEERQKQEKAKQEQLSEELLEMSQRQGALQSWTAGYDEQENTFNTRYGANLNRNILGEYEPGELALLKKDLEKQLQERKRQILADYREKEQLAEKLKGLNRNLADSREEGLRQEARKTEAEKELSQAEQELRERRVILKYLEVPEEQLFDRTGILAAADRKLAEAELLKRRLQKEEDELQKEYVRLTQGKVLELPEEFAALLEELGLHPVFGMEYLNKNGNTPAQNQKLVKEHPFLPYALILSQKELAKLSAYQGEIYTSFPIPIVLRESLDRPEGKDGNIVELGQVSFYVLFNENLLDEEKLACLVREKEQQRKKVNEALALRTREYQESVSRRERILLQKVTKESYEEVQERLLKLAEEIKNGQERQRELAAQIAQGEEASRSLEQKLKKEEQDQQLQERRFADFESLQEAYERYLEQRLKLHKLQKEMQRAQERKKLLAGLLENLAEKRRTLENRQDEAQRKIKELRQKCTTYQEYCEKEPGEDGNTSSLPTVSEALELEARYQAITSGLSMELKTLEELFSRTRERLDKAVNRLQELQKKYGLAEGAWLQITYSAKEESHQEILLEDKKKRKNRLDVEWNKENTSCKILENKLSERKDDLKKRFGSKEPLPEEEILIRDFQARLKELEYQEKELMLGKEQWESKAAGFEEQSAALAEFGDLPVTASVVWEQDFGQMSRKELTQFQGMLRRDYRSCIKERDDARGSLVQLLNKIVRKEQFRDEFYRKPLESMLELTQDDPAQVRSQLHTTTSSYERLMEKLEVDISLVEKEKAKIQELLLDYLSEVHENLGRIDHNSTITIRERPVKMLKLQLPDWEENLSLYQVRLNDYIDELTQKGLEIFERNENAQEYFGSRMTTRNLYDQVVGIANVQIRLYKVEEQREYPITWAEVARNSGGEGFLSAFIILTSLLYYMRKDDSDIFADRNEGKVLLMDNPFAQTNAAHLLKPLMDMAKKTNTQLICLSGLGGDSIYNRFDNIYVLNLIAASLRGGMQYLKGNHTRGAEPETMIVSQIEVLEQQELIF